MSKHSPSIYLAAARSRYGLATESCPHWDYDGFDSEPHACCYELMRAEQALKTLKRAIAKVQS
jgi:hypothetical protein